MSKKKKKSQMRPGVTYKKCHPGGLPETDILLSMALGKTLGQSKVLIGGWEHLPRARLSVAASISCLGDLIHAVGPKVQLSVPY